MTNLNHSRKEIYNRDCYNPVKENFMAFSYSEHERRQHTPHSLEKWLHLPGASPVSVSSDFKPSADIEKQFNELAAAWKKDIGGYSTMAHMALNNNYLDIIAIGPSVIPYILKDLQKSPGHWHIALKHLAKDNPVAKGDMSKMNKIREAWLKWGREKGLIK